MDEERAANKKRKLAEIERKQKRDAPELEEQEEDDFMMFNSQYFRVQLQVVLTRQILIICTESQY